MRTNMQTSGGWGIFNVSGNVGNERSGFGKETVSKVDCSGSARLNGTIVRGRVEAGGSVTAAGATVDGIDAGGSVSATSTICSGKVLAGGSINATSTQATALGAGGSVTLIGSAISNEVSAGGSVEANRCEQLGAVNAGGSVDLDECPSVRSISAGNHVTLRQAKVQGNVIAGGGATIDRSKVGGTLTCTSNQLVIENSEIDTVKLHSALNNSRIVVERGCVTMTGAVVNGSFSCHISSRNGITINGVPVSQYQASQEANPAQTLVLRNSHVKHVIFEGGKGEVVLSGNSQVTGDVTGGKIKN